MRFRTVILVSIWAVVAGALLVGYFLVDLAMRQHVESRTTRDLRTHRSTILEFNTLRMEELGKTSELFAETPRLKAVVELGDTRTIRQLMGDLRQSIRSDILALQGNDGRTVYGLFHGVESSFPPNLIPGGTAAGGRRIITAVTGFDTSVYRFASAPIMVGNDVMGRLVIGFRIARADLLSLREMMGSELILLRDGRVNVSTFAETERTVLEGWFNGGKRSRKTAEGTGDAAIPLAAPDETYLATMFALGPERQAGGTGVELVILKPVLRETEVALKPVMQSFAALSVVVLLITVTVGFFVAKSVTKPVSDLVKGTAEISRGNYDYHIDIPRNEEMKFLATKFGEMSASLKEKISQLGHRNLELEMAFRKLRETQEELVRSERLAATGRVTAQLSHEINNPVHNILSSLQTALRKSPADAPGRELLEVAYDEVERLARLTKQLLSAHRDSTPAASPGVRVILDDVIHDVLASSAESLRQRAIEITEDLAAGRAAVRGSADRLKQLFLNLVVNARDAMPDGGRLSVASRVVNGQLRVTVKDTGIGIPPENINRVFDAFFTTKGKVSGTGLGLSVSYGIVQQHRGRISVDSAPGEGAAFTVTFPAHVDHVPGGRA